MAQDYGTTSGFSVQMEGPFGSVTSTSKVTQVSLPASGWKNADSPYTQTVDVPGIISGSRVDILANHEQIHYLYENGIALFAENDGGTVTFYAIGHKPNTDLVMQATITEVRE